MTLAHKHNWSITRTIWPYADGWGTYCDKCKTVVDTGLEKEEAIKRRDALRTKEGLNV
jgi:hypothetical protein